MSFPLTWIFHLLRLLSYVHGFPIRSEEAKHVSSTIRATWENPSDTMTILLIIGGDTVRQALAQLSGPYVVPVAFSFGWIGYSFDTLMSVVGNGRLMPPPDYDAKLINSTNGFVRDNRSWVLGRLLRDFERPMEDDTALRATVFEASNASEAGVPVNDRYWLGGVFVIIVQLVVAAIPCIREDDWSILLITSAGTVLALFTGALPQWRFEKWACRRNTNKTLCLTGGNGTRNVMVIIGSGVGLDLEDLAAAESPRLLRRNESRAKHTLMDLPLAFRITQISCIALSVLWIVLLITVTGLKQNTWFLLLVGGLGMGQNVVVAGARRKPSASGIHLKEVKEFKEHKVMHVLMDIEREYPGTGRSLLSTFFPDEKGLRRLEIDWWNGDREGFDRKRAENTNDHIITGSPDIAKVSPSTLSSSHQLAIPLPSPSSTSHPVVRRSGTRTSAAAANSLSDSIEQRCLSERS
jgi:hypothetical protein